MFTPLSLRYLLVSLALLTISTANSQITKVPYRVGNLWGYADTSGHIITPPKYDSVDFEYHSNYCHIVYKNGNIGLVNKDGKEIIETEYSTIIRDKEIRRKKHNNATLKGYYVTKNNKVGFIDYNGRTHLATIYDEIIDFTFTPKNNYYTFLVKNKTMYSIVNSNAKVLVDSVTAIKNKKRLLIYDMVSGGKHGVFSLWKNKWLALPKYDTIQILSNDKWNTYRYLEYFYYGLQVGDTTYIADYSYQIQDAVHTGSLDSYLEKCPAPLPFPPLPPTEPSILTIIQYPTRGNILHSKTITSKEAPKAYAEFTEDLYIGYKKAGNRLSMWKHGTHKVEKIKGLWCDTLMIFKTRYSNGYTQRYHKEKIEQEIFLAINQNGKWGIYQSNISEWLIPPSLDNIKLQEEYTPRKQKYNAKSNVLLTQKANKFGLIACDDNGNLIHISPEYDAYLATNFIMIENKRFYCYTFLKNGQKYIVGQNGVVFAK